MKYQKIVLVFPGQGSQYEGMGKDLYNRFNVAKEVYKQASDILGYDIAKLCFEEHKLTKYEPNFDQTIRRLTKNRVRLHVDEGIKRWIQRATRPILHQTIYTQPAVLATSYACYKALEEICNQSEIELKPFLVAGHSLGEYTALVAAGAMNFETALKLVDERAFCMADTARWLKRYKLMIVLNKKEINFDNISNLCMEYGSCLSLVNSPKQAVVGGPKRGLIAISRKLKKEGYFTRFIDLEGPFHTLPMQPAAKRFNLELKKRDGESYVYPIKLPAIPIIANVTAEAIVDPDRIRQELYEQIYKLVNWKGSVEKAIEQEVDLFIEIGPRKILSGLIRDTNPQAKILNVEDTMSLEETVKELSQ